MKSQGPFGPAWRLGLKDGVWEMPWRRRWDRLGCGVGLCLTKP